LASGQFAALYRRGTRSKSNGLLVISAPADPGPPQVGIVAGRGVGNAVRRNRAKRRLREAMSRAGLRSDTAYVVVASPEVVTMPFDRLMARLAEAITGIEETER
jgi:ribonuclease P protein component